MCSLHARRVDTTFTSLPFPSLHSLPYTTTTSTSTSTKTSTTTTTSNSNTATQQHNNNSMLSLVPWLQLVECVHFAAPAYFFLAAPGAHHHHYHHHHHQQQHHHHQQQQHHHQQQQQRQRQRQRERQRRHVLFLVPWLQLVNCAHCTHAGLIRLSRPSIRQKPTP